MTVQDILVKNKVFKEVGVDINFNLQVTRDCYIHTQRQIEKAMQEYARLKCQELLLLVADKAKVIGEVEQNSDFNYVTPDDIIIVDKDSIFNAVDLNKFIV